MQHLGVALISASLAATLACARVVAEDATTDVETRDTAAVDAQRFILDAFDRYSVIGGMNASHGLKQVDDFILSLIQNPDLPDKVNDIAVECGNALYQSTLDRYIAGDDVPFADVRKVWRNTSQIGCAFSTFNEQLFPLVRRINQRLPAQRKLRMLACDPPIDWSKIHSMDDLIPFMDRDASIAAVMEREVLQKHRKALMLFGIHHMMHGGSGAVGRYEQDGYPNLTFVIAPHVGFGNHTPLAPQNDLLETRMASWPVPSIATIKDTWLARLDPAYFQEEAAFPGQLGYPGIDGYLYTGLRDFLLREPGFSQTILDQAYITELGQRADSIGAPPGAPMRPENQLRLESSESAFNYEP